ncbi:MAG: hypothetical protein ABSE80_13720 [Halobacteriota archaeon]|jgi:hypothetical protein
MLASKPSRNYNRFSSHRDNHYIRIEIDGAMINIPVSDEIYAYWQAQFVRSNPTDLQRNRYAMLKNLIRAAYKEWFMDRSKKEFTRASEGER